MIEFTNVKLMYVKEFYALYNVNFKVNNGEKVALTGAQDSGKTSLLRIFAKLEKPDSGEICYNDIPLTDIDYEKDLSVAYVSNTPILLRSSVRKNIEYVLKVRKYPKAERAQVIDKTLDDFALKSVANEKIKNISMYQKRLLQFAMLSTRPRIDVLLVDDILVGLSETESKTIKEILKTFMNKKGTTTFFACSNESIAKELCDKIVYLKLGAVEKIESAKLKI